MVEEHSHNAALPVWEQPELWTRASAIGSLVHVEDEAVRLGERDLPLKINHCDVWLGQQKLLHGSGSLVSSKLRKDFGFSALDFFDSQRRFLLRVFRTFFPEDEE